MIPWPLAALTILYGLLAFLSAVQLITCAAQHQLAGGLWSTLWFVVTAASAIGLPSKSEWGRRCAVAAAAFFVAGALAAALVLVTHRPPEPGRALVDTLLAGAALVVIRYLSRPVIKEQFRSARTAP